MLRNSKNNKIICGVCFGGHPTSDVLFNPVLEEIEAIKNSGELQPTQSKIFTTMTTSSILGFSVTVNGALECFKVGLYGVLCDTPAKAIVMNMKQLNG